MRTQNVRNYKKNGYGDGDSGDGHDGDGDYPEIKIDNLRI